MNKSLLKQLYCVFSPSNGEKKMRKFIKRYAYKNCGDIKIEQDKSGNLLITKGVSDTYPCVAAHIDQVQHKHSKDFCCIGNKDVIMGFSPKSREQQGLGADDKNGIFVALECLAKFDVLKVALFVGEEIGCVGSSDVDMSFFDDCRFVIEADRRNAGDLITDISGELCSEEFLNDIHYADFGYSPTHGMTTDVAELKDRGLKVSCINMSCGYYEPHTDKEFTILSELENCLNFAMYIIENCTKVYPHEYEYVSRFSSFRGSWDDWYGYPIKQLATTKPEDEDLGYTNEEFELDYDIIESILTDEPWLTLDDLWKNYRTEFWAKSKEDLKDVYAMAAEAVTEAYTERYAEQQIALA